jgi:hypothetical protein
MYEPCCNDEGLGFDLAGCTSWFSRVTDAYWNGDFQTDEATACLDALAEARAADPDRCRTVSIFDAATLREECARAFTPGSRDGAPLGGECLLAADCASAEGGAVICYGGNCLLEKKGAEGDGPCSLIGTDGVPTEIFVCEGDTYCDREQDMCVPKVSGGERCPYPTACLDTAMCSGGVCYDLPAEGEECLNGVPGAGGYCEAGSVCDRTTLVCGPGRAEGEACQDGECESGVCLDGICAKSDFTDNLNCTG